MSIRGNIFPLLFSTILYNKFVFEVNFFVASSASCSLFNRLNEERKKNMYKFSIGVLLNSFRMDTPSALKKAAELGLQGIQVPAAFGELSPAELTGDKKKEFLKMVKDNGLTISALCGDLGQGFGNAEKNPQLIDESKRIPRLRERTGNKHRNYSHRRSPQ